MKEELMALQELFRETILKYGIKYATAASFKDGVYWISIQTKRGIIDVNNLEESDDLSAN